MHFFEDLFFGVEEQNHDFSGVRPQYHVIAVVAGQTEGRDRTDRAVDLLAGDGLEFAMIIRTQQLQDFSSWNNEFLCFWMGKIAINDFVDGCSFLQGQPV